MKHFIAQFLATFILLSSCSQKSPQPTAYTGAISFNANLSSSEPLSNYTAEYNAIFQAGARGAQTAAPWGSLNPSGTNFSFAIIDNPYFGLKAIADQGFDVIFLNVPIITVNQRSMPSDISALAFDAPQVKARFHALLDSVNKRLSSKVKYISFGNEVDTYFSAHPSEWTAYINLVADARSYVKSLNSSLIVGATTTFSGASTTAASQVSTLNADMDAVMLTYYPISGSTFVPRDPSTVSTDVANMLKLASGKPIVVQEWGYPSSTSLGSSEEKQSQFYSNSITEIKKRTATVFPFVSFFKFRDWNSTYVQSITGQSSGQSFYEFMSSLGVEKNDGTAKQAFSVIKSAIK